jgi:hypothetical protein
LNALEKETLITGGGFTIFLINICVVSFIDKTIDVLSLWQLFTTILVACSYVPCVWQMMLLDPTASEPTWIYRTNQMLQHGTLMNILRIIS